jgi:hypothetical protein
MGCALHLQCCDGELYMVVHFVSQNKSVHHVRWCVLYMTVFHSALNHFYHVFVHLESK